MPGISDVSRVYDWFTDMSGGQDDGRSPDLIGLNQAARLENCVCRGGFVKTRPGFRGLTINHLSTIYYDEDGFYSETEDGDDSETVFMTGLFQSAWYYCPQGQTEVIMANIGGRLFRVDPRPNNILDVTEIRLDRRNSILYPITYAVQADRFFILQDGESRAIIYDGVNARRAADDEVITGTIMAYGMGRLVVVKGHEVYFGDLYGSHAGPPGDSVLKFTETTFLNEGGAAAIAPSMGKIKALTFTPQQDSSTGDGELLAFAERGVTSFFVSTPREEWKQSAFQRITLLNVGAKGWRGVVSINGDVWFRADDGFRSYRQARAEQQGWAHLPMSTEVRTFIDNDTPDLLDYCSTIRFDNRMIGTCTPTPNEGKLYHQGMLVLDFDVLSTFGQAARPAWDGHWKKPKVTQLVAGMFHGEHRAFSFALNVDNENVIYEITKTDRKDYDGAISSEMDERSMSFKSRENSPMDFSEKELYGGDLWIDNITEPVTFTIYFRPDQHPEWTFWQTLAEIEPVGECQKITCGGCPTIRNNFFPRRRLKKPADECDADWTKRDMRRGYEFQRRLTWTGHASIRKGRMHAKVLTEDSTGSC